MTLQQLEYVLAVDKFRHFAKAAEYCCVTQPTLSTMIQKLEEELGAVIFDRASKPISPTPAGVKIIEQARIISSQTERLKHLVEEETGSLRGSFRLAMLPTIAPYLLPRFYPRFVDTNRELDIKVSEMQTARCKEALLSGEIDAAIIASDPEHPLLHGDTLFYERFFVYISREEPLFDHKVIKPSDITGRRLWLLDEGHCFRDQLIKFCSLEAVKLNQRAYRLGSLETFMRMVEGGDGITFIPELSVAQLSEEQKSLVRPFSLPHPTRRIVMVTRTDFIRRKILELLTAAIVESVPKEMRTPLPSCYII